LFRLVACMMTPLALYAGLEATTCSLKRLQERDCRSDLLFFVRLLTRFRTSAARFQRSNFPVETGTPPCCRRYQAATVILSFYIISYVSPVLQANFFSFVVIV
jgi:hypothetical protein